MKKLNKLFAILVAMAMVLSLTAISAFAATGNKAADEDHPATASVSKTLKVPTGTTPSGTYTLSFNNTAAPDDTTAPAITKAFTFAGTEIGTDDGNGTTTYVIRDDNFLPQGNTWPAAGVYKYDVAETAPDSAVDRIDTVTTANPTTETKTYYSQAEYELVVGIATKANGDRYVDSVAVYQTKDDEGKTVTKAKVDITIPEDEEGKTPTPSGFNFTNEILSKKISEVTPTGGDENDDNAMYINKKVVKVVDNAETEITPDQEFTFTLNVTKPAKATAEETYAYKILKADNSVKETDSVTTGTAKSFKLAAGERLVFTNISVGAKYNVNEASYPAYTTEDNMDTDYVYVKDTGNAKQVKNVYDENDDPATGLSIANLPFIVLALVAVGGLVAYVVVRRKSEDNA